MAVEVGEVAEVIEDVFSTEVEFTAAVGEGEMAVDVAATSERAARRLQDLGLLA